MKRLRLPLALLVVATVAVASLCGAARYYLTSRHDQVAAKLQAVLGVPVRIGEADIGVRGGTSLSRVEIFEGDGQRPDKPWLSVEEVRADLSAVDVVGGSVSPKHLRLCGAAIDLRFDEDGHLLTRLPRIKSTGEPFPHLLLERGRLTLHQEGRPPMIVDGVDGEADDTDGLGFHGTVHDDYWGEWTVRGSLDTATGLVKINLKAARADVTQEKLERLPFVSPSVWEQVKLKGVTPVDLRLDFTLGKGDVHYRLELDPEDTTVHVTSIDLHADKASGKVIVEDRQVKLLGVRGRTADGAINLPDAVLSFRERPYALTFSDINVSKVDLRKLPESWKIPLPKTIKSRMLLTGQAKLNVAIDNGKALTSGDGDGFVETVVIFPTKVKVRLHADADGFHFSTPALSRDDVMNALLATAVTAPLDEPVTPRAITGPIEQAIPVLRAVTGGAVNAGGKAMSQIDRWTKKLPPGQKTSYLDATITLKDVDIEELLKQLEVKSPIELSGKLSFRVQLGVPIDTPNEMRAYRVRGTAESPRLNIAGVEMKQVTAKVRYEDGVLTLDELKGAFPDSEGSFDGSGKLQYIPLGDLTLKMTVDRVPLARALALLPGAEGKGEGTLSGQFEARVAADKVREPKAWVASGALRSDRLAAYGIALTKANLKLTVKDGVARAHDLDAVLEGGRVGGEAEVRWDEGYPYLGKLELKDADLTALQRLSPDLRPGVTVKGQAGIVAEFQGKLTPLSYTASGTAQAKELTVEEVAVESVAFKWTLEKDRLKLRDLAAKLYDGNASGSATIPLAETVAGEAEVKLETIDAQKLVKAAQVIPFKIEGRVSGTVSGTLSGAAPGKARALTTKIDLAAPKMRVQGVAAQKVKGTVNYRAGTGDYKLEGEALGGTFELEGKLPPVKERPKEKENEQAQAEEPDGRLRIRGMKLSQLGEPFGMQERLPVSGVVEIDLPYRHEGPDRRPVGAGRFRITDVGWGGRELADTIQGDVRLTGTTLQVRDISGNLGEGSLRGQVFINLKQVDRSWFTLQIERVPAGLLMGPLLASPGSQPDLSSSPIQGVIELHLRGNLGSEWRANGHIGLTRGKLYGAEVSELRLPISVSHVLSQGTGHLAFNDNNAQIAGGRAQGRATLRWGSGLRLEGLVRFFDVDLPSLLRSTGEASRIATGRLSGRLEFDSDNLRTADDLNATLEASFSQAQPLQLPVLDVVSRYVVPGHSTMTFPKGDIRATLSRGVVRIKRLTMSNPSVQMVIEGTTTLAGRVDLDVTARTGTVGINANALRLLGVRIPAVGPIPLAVIVEASAYLSNRVVHLRVTGTVNNPSVQVDPVRLLTEEAIRYFLTQSGAPLP